MDDELQARFAASRATKSAPVDPSAIRQLARQRRSRRRMANSGVAAVCLLAGLVAWGGPDGSETSIEVYTPPPSSSTTTTTTAFDPVWVPGTTAPVERDIDWDDAPEPCGEPGAWALRADLTGNGTEAYITDVANPSPETDDIPDRLLRACDGDQVWDFEVGYLELMSTVKVHGRWFIGWGGTSGLARYQTLLTLVDGQLVTVFDNHGEPIRLIEGNVADEPLQIRDWWGCEQDSLVTANRETGTREWHLTHYRWDDDAGHMVIHGVETRGPAPASGSTSTYGEGLEDLADVLPAACVGSDDWGPGGVPRWIDDNREPRWLGWPSIPYSDDQ